MPNNEAKDMKMKKTTMTVIMALPLYALYEVSIIVSWITHRLRQRRIRRAEAARSIGGAEA